MKRFYLTTPIYYVNDLPHIGHAYTTVVADVIARFQRLSGRKVYFLTGTDEHGQKIERAAAKQGIPPLRLADDVVVRYHDLWRRLEITHDDFIRTTQKRHELGVTKIFQRIQENKDIYLDQYEGFYCTGCEAFYPDNQVSAGLCPEQRHPVERVKEESYFFRLSRYQKPLLEFYGQNPGFVRPEGRYNEVRRFAEMGLKDLSISRTAFTWGIPLPGDPRHVVYVWFDALCNYVSALGYAEHSELYADCWPADLHLVGKDILKFHAVYWPAFLMAAGLPLPRLVFAHGWWLRSDAKMSKSTGNIVDPLPLLNDFGASALRYFMLREMAFGQDAQFSEEGLVDRVNTDLANDLGNLVSRLLKMLEDFCGGRIPRTVASDGSLEAAARQSVSTYRAAFEEYRFHEGLAVLWSLVGQINRFIVRWEPWSLAKDASQRERLESVLYDAAEAVRVVAVALLPVMPSAAQQMLGQLGCPDEDPTGGFDELTWGRLPSGQAIRRGAPLFPRIDKAAYFAAPTLSQKETRMDQPDPTQAGAPASDTITIDDFMKVKLRVGKVVEAERLAGADKLLKLQVDIGTERRTVLAGIALQYPPETLLGKSVILVANLAPRKMRGVESQGMILAADAAGTPIVATFESEVPPGSTVR